MKKKITKPKSYAKENKENKRNKRHIVALLISISSLGVLLIFGAYAWFSTTTNVKIKTFSMVVTKNSGLSISFDGINFDTTLEISRDVIIDEVKNTYPNHVNQWANNGLTPVSTAGVLDSNSYFFEVFESRGGVFYRNKSHDVGYVSVAKSDEDTPRNYNSFVAFDLFLKNETDSPVSDNLYFASGTGIRFENEESEEMTGLLNSVRIGIVKVGSTDLKASANTIQNLQCNNDCKSVIYEPYSTNHTELSKERAKGYGIHLEDGRYFPTFAYIKEASMFKVAETISGTYNMNFNYFKEQETINEDDFDNPIFTIPNGITKVRVYVWIEGQDIDSLETDSEGAELAISINFIKDTVGTDSFN